MIEWLSGGVALLLLLYLVRLRVLDRRDERIFQRARSYALAQIGPEQWPPAFPLEAAALERLLRACKVPRRDPGAVAAAQEGFVAGGSDRLGARLLQLCPELGSASTDPFAFYLAYARQFRMDLGRAAYLKEFLIYQRGIKFGLDSVEYGIVQAARRLSREAGERHRT